MKGNRWTEIEAPVIRVVWSWSERMIGEREDFIPVTEAGFQVKAVGHVQMHRLIYAIRWDILHLFHVSK